MNHSIALSPESPAGHLSMTLVPSHQSNDWVNGGEFRQSRRLVLIECGNFEKVQEHGDYLHIWSVIAHVKLFRPDS
jgi:hypothetical protein